MLSTVPSFTPHKPLTNAESRRLRQNALSAEQMEVRASHVSTT